MKNTVLIVDQTAIPASMDCESLFINDYHVLDVCDEDGIDIHSLAEKIASAIEAEVNHVVLSEKDLAKSMAQKNGEIDEFHQHEKESEDFDGFVQGYDNNDLLQAVEDLKVEGKESLEKKPIRHTPPGMN